MAVLGSLIEQVRGVSYKPEDLHTTLNENSITLLRANNIKDGQLNFADVVYVDKKKVSDKQFPKAPHLLICASSGRKELVGKAAYVECNLPMTFGAFCKVVRPKTDCPQYIGHFFNSPYYRDRIANSAAGANINNIRNEHIDVLEIAWPSVEGQRSAVAILDKVSELIALRQEQLTKLDELVKSRFIELFGLPVSNSKGWNTEKMREVAPAVNYSGDFEETVWLLNLDMVEAQTGRILDYLYVNEEEVGNSTCTFDTTNVLYSKLRPYLNKVVIPDRCGYATSELIPLKPNPMKLERTYLAFMLRSDEFVNMINEKVAGAKMPRVSMGDFREFDVPVPPIELQKQFAAFVEQTDKSKLAIQESLAELETLKKALMQIYFG